MLIYRLAKIGENVKIVLKKIAVTGSIAAGKSTVCKYFKQLGAYVVDADSIVHKLLASKTNIKQQLIKFLGKDILEKGEINRKKVADKVFDDSKKLKKLEAIIHPKVFEEIDKLFLEAKKKNKYNLFVVEIPLIFEIHQEKFYDFIIFVNASKKIRKERFLKKDFEKREKRKKIPIEKKTKKADFVINNNSDYSALKRQVKKIANSLLKL